MSVFSFAPLPALVFVSLAAVAVAGCDATIRFGDDVTRRVDHETIPADEVTSIDVSTDNGRIDIVGRAGVDEIEIDVIMVEADAHDADYSVRLDDHGELAIAGECDAAWHDRCTVGFVVTMPSDRPVDVTTDNGMISLDGLDGDLDAHTDNGAIVGASIGSTHIVARTDNGRIRLELEAVPDLVDVRTDNGAIAIDVPDADYVVDAESDNGSVDIDVRRDDEAPRSITARSDNGTINIETRNIETRNIDTRG